MKQKIFFENVKLIQDRFDITPLMYGSVGLEYITGESLNADDVDILIPEVFIKERWGEFKDFLLCEGYVLTDEHEHTFLKDGVLLSYASVEELESFAQIRVTEFGRMKYEDISVKLLSLEQYLKVYRASSKDGYRINVRQKKDREKIAFIEKCLDKKA